MSKISIKNWAEDDRPREKLLNKGAGVLSNAELLAIIINNGTKDLSAVDVSKNLLAATGNSLTRLGKMTVKDILQLKVKGIGEAKAVFIVAALELLNRKNQEEHTISTFNSSKDAAAFVRAKLQAYTKEVFGVLFLNRANRIIAFEIISEGGFTSTVVDPRLIFKRALVHNTTALILSHNHPSGNVKPSASDEELTKKIVSAGRFLDIRVLDHVIVSDNGYFSFADEGLL
ncbi:DNA repair protein RadC [Haoranjiania flava]|uniref:DNA repair protein RadC n=1 Tax=Haoranjiania flava TaxID=1856322 RepID=A0AAE3IP41_9BACT|nr:DNA repair protein RadC [Haoranjiania flava]MCU7693212.1 DNA repair protein RadC [Haoranjiania flava]